MFPKRAVAGLVASAGLLGILTNTELLFAQKPTLTVEVRQGRIDPAEFKNPDGWSWLVRPRALRVGGGTIQTKDTGILKLGSHIDVHDGSVQLSLIQTGPTEPRVPPNIRLVVLDAAGNRYLPQFKVAGTYRTRSEPDKTYLSESIFRLDPLVLDPKKVVRVGVEEMVPKKSPTK